MNASPGQSQFLDFTGDADDDLSSFTLNGHGRLELFDDDDGDDPLPGSPFYGNQIWSHNDDNNDRASAGRLTNLCSGTQTSAL